MSQRFYLFFSLQHYIQLIYITLNPLTEHLVFILVYKGLRHHVIQIKGKEIHQNQTDACYDKPGLRTALRINHPAEHSYAAQRYQPQRNISDVFLFPSHIHNLFRKQLANQYQKYIQHLINLAEAQTILIIYKRKNGNRAAAHVNHIDRTCHKKNRLYRPAVGEHDQPYSHQIAGNIDPHHVKYKIQGRIDYEKKSISQHMA